MTQDILLLWDYKYGIYTFDISVKNPGFSLSNDITQMSYLIQDFPLKIVLIISILYRHVHNIHLEGTIFHLGLSFKCMLKKREDLADFFSNKLSTFDQTRTDLY